MPDFVLHIFPESSLASSLITTVWIGVFVTCFFNLRFGWNKSGLIIPGYLVPLLILKPWSAVAIIIEGLVTYLIMKIISEFGSFSKLWSNYFGRDRFFLIFLIAIIVRILFDEILFPQFTLFLSHYFNIDFVYKGGLYSIGLVIVALTANYFWNSGLKRGFPHLIVILLVTFIIIKYVLITYTNFRLNNIVYLYEDIATSIAASPKAYIILTVTAFIASRMNLLYGWEFSGIIIPALLALQWYYPWKIASSLIEAGIIYGIAALVLKSRFFLNSTIEGARKILLFFNIAFLYKIFLGFVLPLIYSDAPITDTFGLGYMLTSLIAIKMYDKKIGIKMARSILQVSVVSVIVATLIGFSLLYLPNFFKNNAVKSKRAPEHVKIHHIKRKTLSDVISGLQVKLYGNNKYNEYTFTKKDIENFEAALLALKYYIDTKSASSLQYAAMNLDKLLFKITIIQDKYILLSEKEWNSPRGIYVISINQNAENLLLSVPYPLGNPALITSAVSLFTKNNARALAISTGLEKKPGDILKLEDTFFSGFIDFYSSDNTGVSFFEQNLSFFNPLGSEKNKKNTSYVICSDPLAKAKSNIDFSKVFGNIHDIVNPEVFKGYNNLKDSSVILYLSPEALINQLSGIKKYNKLASNSMNKVIKPFDKVFNVKRASGKGIFSYFADLFTSRSKTKYDKTILTNQKADFIDKNIISPLVDLTIANNDLNSAKFLTKVKFIDFAADDIGYSLSLCSHNELGKTDYIVLNKLQNENKKNKKHLEGAYFFRITQSNPFIFEVFDLNRVLSFELTNLLTRKFNPSVLMFAISPTLNLESEELMDFNIPSSSMFNLINQVAMRNMDTAYGDALDKKKKNISKPLTLQLKILKNSKKIKYEKNTVYISTYLGKYKYSQLSSEEKSIYKYLKELGFKIKFANSDSLETAGLEVLKFEQAHYIPFTRYFDFMVLWFSPEINMPMLKAVKSKKEVPTVKKKNSPQKTK